MSTPQSGRKRVADKGNCKDPETEGACPFYSAGLRPGEQYLRVEWLLCGDTLNFFLKFISHNNLRKQRLLSHFTD